LRELLAVLPRNNDRSFLEEAQASMRDWWALMEERGTEEGTPMQPDVVTWNLGDLLRDDAIVCGDSGTAVTLLARMKLRGQQRFSFSGTLCSMAAGLPYAIGAQIAYPDRQVVAVVGDGALSMMMGDLVTLCAHGLPVKVIVLKNNTLGLIKWEQMVFLGNPEYGVDLAPIDFVKVAEACGARGVRIEEPRDCRGLLQEALMMRGPVVVEAVIDKFAAPMPPKITKDQAKKLGLALARGEPARRRIALTMTRRALDEAAFAASPMGAPARAMRKLVGPPSEAADTGRSDHRGLEALGATVFALGTAALVARLRRGK
jgi:pyruvate dehydrogenase (quinone)/pyruvate oxidase